MIKRNFKKVKKENISQEVNKLQIKNRNYNPHQKNGGNNFPKKEEFQEKIVRKIRIIKKKKNLQRKTVDGTAIFKYKINILVKQHNVFCSLTTTKDNKTLHMCSTGKYKIKISKKTLTYNYY